MLNFFWLGFLGKPQAKKSAVHSNIQPHIAPAGAAGPPRSPAIWACWSALMADLKSDLQILNETYSEFLPFLHFLHKKPQQANQAHNGTQGQHAEAHRLWVYLKEVPPCE